MIKVIVAITTYNLEKYISRALDSVLSQKTKFPFRIIVADDHSSDGTPDILSEYQKKYPEIIEVMYSDTNLGSVKNANRIFDGIQCEYFSFLDGDDYWVTDSRLQMQVDFLDTNPKYMMCGGETCFLKNDSINGAVIPKERLDATYYFEDYLKGRSPFVHTSSILLRNSIFINGVPDVFKTSVGTFEECTYRGEDFRFLLHLEKGPIYVFPDVLSVYRIHEKGMWQGKTMVKRKLEYVISRNGYAKYFDGKYNSTFRKWAKGSINNLMKYIILCFLRFNRCVITAEQKEMLDLYMQDVARNRTYHSLWTFNNFMLFKIVLKYTIKISE